MLPTSKRGCGLRFYPDTAPAGYISGRLHTSAAVISAVETAEAAQAAAAASEAVAAAGAGASAATPTAAVPADGAATTPSPVADISADIAAALRSLPGSARAEVDLSDIGGEAKAIFEKYKGVQRKMTHEVEKAREKSMHASVDAALAAEVPNSERHAAALRTKAHLNPCDGGWVNAPPLSHMRLPNTLFAIRLRRYLNLPIPVCEDIGDGAGSARPPRSGDGKPWDPLGDFTLSTFNIAHAAQWLNWHEDEKLFWYNTAKQAGITGVTQEKHVKGKQKIRPGDVGITSTTHGWKAAEGKGLLLDVAHASAVCGQWVAKCAKEAGGGAAGKNAEKHDYYKGKIPDDQHFISLASESEGRKCREAGQLLHAWSKLWAERRGESKAAAARMLFKWTTELDFRNAKNLAKCINERALLSKEMQDNEDKVGGDVRPPLSSHVDLFTVR